MEQSISKIHFVPADLVDAAYGQHYRSPEIPGYAGIVVFDRVAQPCTVTEGDLHPRNHSGEAGDGYLDRFGGFECSRCHRELAWSPNWVAEGVFGDDTHSWTMRQMERLLQTVGLAEDAAEVMAKSLLFKSLYEAGPSEAIVIQQVEPQAPAKTDKMPSRASLYLVP